MSTLFAQTDRPKTVKSEKKKSIWNAKNSYCNCPKNGTVWFDIAVMHPNMLMGRQPCRP